MRAFLHQLFTEQDNHTADLGRVLWAMGFVWALALDTYLVIWRTQPFDLLSAGAGLGTVLTAGAGALALKRKTQSGSDEP